MLSTKHHQHPLFDNFPGQHFLVMFSLYLYIFLYIFLGKISNRTAKNTKNHIKQQKTKNPKTQQLYIGSPTIIFECKRNKTARNKKKFIITTFVGVNACYFNFIFLFSILLSISTAQLKLIYLFLLKSLCCVKVPQSNETSNKTTLRYR